jgi:hypothetical protein
MISLVRSYRFILPVLLIVVLLSWNVLPAFAVSTAFVDGTTGSGLAGGSPDCANTGNAVTANNSRSDCDSGEEVVISNFGLTSLGIPAGATDIGFVVQLELRMIHIKGRLDFESVLTPDQKAQLKKITKERMDKMREHHGENRPHRGPGAPDDER